MSCRDHGQSCSTGCPEGRWPESWTGPGCQRGNQGRDLPVAKELLLSVEGEVQDCEQRTLAQEECCGGEPEEGVSAHVVQGGAALGGLL